MSRDTFSRRTFLQYAAGATGALALAACAPAGTPSGSAGEGGAPGEETATLTFGHHWEAAFRPTQDEWDEMYLAEHPNVQIDVTYNTWSDHNQIVPTWAAADTLPDIIYVHGSRSFPWAFEGILADIQSFVDADEGFNVSGIWEEALNLYRYQGNLYSIPYDHGPIILGYNKDMFDAAGLDYPSEDWTMDDLRNAAIALTDTEADIPQWGWSGSYPAYGNTQHGPGIGPWGGRLMNEEQTELLLNSDEAIEGSQFWYNLIHTDGAAPTPAESQAFEQGPWISGQVGLNPTASWNTPTLASFATFAWDVAPWPTGPAGQATGSFGSGFGVTKNSTNPQAAWDYLSAYLSVEGMEFMWGSTGRGSPARNDAYASWMESEAAPENAQYFLEALDTYAVTGSPYKTLAAAELNDITERHATLLRSGEATDVAAEIAAIAEEAEPVLADANERLAAATSS